MAGPQHRRKNSASDFRTAFIRIAEKKDDGGGVGPQNWEQDEALALWISMRLVQFGRTEPKADAEEPSVA
jgi:hypothetical protein